MACLALDEQRIAIAHYLWLASVATPSTLLQPGSYSTSAPLYECTLDVDCVYSRRHFAAALARRPWWHQRENAASFSDHATDVASAHANNAAAAPAHCVIGEYERIPWDEVLKPPHTVTNNILVRKGLCRKAQFSNFMARHAAKCGEACPLRACIPHTVIVDTVAAFIARPAWLDFRSALAEALGDADDAMALAAPGTPWILKPSMANKGAEIFIVTSIAEVEAAVREWRDVGQWVLQRYIDAPMLATPARHKFHLRVYVLADGALSVSVFGEALVLLAARPYARVGASGAALDRHAHITNSCVGVELEEGGGWSEAAFVRKFSELPGLLAGSGACASESHARELCASLWARVEDCIAHSFFAFEGDFSGLMPLPNAWELYGVDFVVDAEGGLHLLEFNPTPDIRQTGTRLDYIIDALMEGMLAITLDQRFPPPTTQALLLPPATCNTPVTANSNCAAEDEHGGASSSAEIRDHGGEHLALPQPAAVLRWKEVLKRTWPQPAGGVSMQF